MAARKRASRTVELANLPDDIPEGATVLIPPEKTVTEERREIEIEELLTEIGTDTTVKIWRRAAAGSGRNALAGEMSGEGFTLDRLLDTFGGGEYVLHIYQGRTAKERVNVSLDASVPPKNPRALAPANGQPVPVVQQTSSMDAIVGVIGAMGTMMAASATANGDMIRNMIALMAARPEKDPMDVALRMAEIMKTNQPSNGSPTDVMSLIERGMAIGQKINGGGENENDVMSIVGQGMGVLGSIVDGIVTEKKAKAAQLMREQGPINPAGASPMLPASTAQAPSAPHTNPEPEMPKRTKEVVLEHPNDRLWMQAARPFFGHLIGAATFMTPEQAAGMIDNNLNDDQFDDLVADVMDETAPGFGGRLVAAFPAVAQVDEEWLGAVLKTLLETDDEDEQEGREPEAQVDTNGKE